MKRIVWVFLGGMAFLTTAHAASFDCEKASTKIEKLICSDDALSKLDDDLSAAYDSALQDDKQATAIRHNQMQWLKSRNRCSEINCIKDAYTTRIAQLPVSQSKDDCFSLLVPLQIVGEQGRKRVCKSEIPKLLRSPITPVNVNDKMMYPPYSEPNQKISNCKQYLSVVGYGQFTGSRRELVIEAPFMQTCGTLVSLLKARHGENYFLSVKDALDPKHIPPSVIIQAATGDQAEELTKSEEDGNTAFDEIEDKNNIVLKDNSLEYDDSYVDVIAIADVDNDGLNDYIITVNYSYEHYSSFYVGYLSPTNRRNASRWVKFDQNNMVMPKP
jgi:uncharacterized protein